MTADKPAYQYMNKKFREALAIRCKDMGLTDKAIDRLSELGGEGLSDDASEEDITAKVEPIIPFALAMQAEITRKTKPQPKKQSTDPSETPNTDTLEGKGEGDQTPDWAKALIDANKALSERLAKMEGERIVIGRKEKLGNIISKLPENLRKPYERTSVDGLTDEQFDALIGDVTTEVDGIAASLDQKGAVFGRPQNGTPLSGKEATDKEVADIVGRYNLD